MTTQHARVLTVPADAAGQRLDRFLADTVPEYSRARLQQWIRDGHVMVGGARIKTSATVRGGERIEILPPVTQPTTLIAEAIPLDILYEDDDIVVINKPAGLAVHPGAGRGSGTLVNALLACVKGLSGIGGVERPGIVHRLDKDTTGVMVVAKHDVAHRNLSQQFQERTVEKCYLAICYGALRGSGTIDLPIGRHPTHRQSMSTRSRQGRPAVTHWRVRESFDTELVLLEVRIATGRTHQIRVHLSAVGHPLVGDPLYGGRKTIQRLPREWQSVVQHFQRPALHAWQLRLQHPMTGAMCEWSAPIPEDLHNLIAELQKIALKQSP